jgi:hypothetical protein
MILGVIKNKSRYAADVIVVGVQVMPSNENAPTVVETVTAVNICLPSQAAFPPTIFQFPAAGSVVAVQVAPLSVEYAEVVPELGTTVQVPFAPPELIQAKRDHVPVEGKALNCSVQF